MFKSICTAATAQNATETTKTLVDTITVPQGVKAMVGLAIQLIPAGFTTLESVSCIIELESDDMAPWGGTQAFISAMLNPVGVVEATSTPPYVHPCNIPVTSGAHIKVSATYDKALTINPLTRCMLQFE